MIDCIQCKNNSACLYSIHYFCGKHGEYSGSVVTFSLKSGVLTKVKERVCLLSIPEAGR